VRSRAALLGLLVAGCSHEYVVKGKDIPFEPPHDLELQLMRFRSGEEKWRGDPKAVAEQAIRQKLDLDAAPWQAGPFYPAAYEVKSNPDWGTYVVRGYTYPSGGIMRYRVKLRPYFEIWYPVELSHQKIHEMPHPALDD
jgi:hypothetical protein